MKNLIQDAFHLDLSLMHHNDPVRLVINKVKVMGGSGSGGSDRRKKLA